MIAPERQDRGFLRVFGGQKFLLPLPVLRLPGGRSARIPRFQVVESHEIAISPGGDQKAPGDGETGPRQAGQVGALATGRGQVGQVGG